MSDGIDFACPRCLEKVHVSDDALQHERVFSFECAHCGRAFTVENGIPDAMDKLFQTLKQDRAKRDD